MKILYALALLFVLSLAEGHILELEAKSPGCDPTIHDCTNADRIV
ncbi:MAG: hypothetical protein ACFB5Z_10485 [Elainellaceae cyanobacterium]